jgi:hypothetical protein
VTRNECALEAVSELGQELDAKTNLPAKGEVFLLDIPFYRTNLPAKGEVFLLDIPFYRTRRYGLLFVVCNPNNELAPIRVSERNRYLLHGPPISAKRFAIKEVVLIASQKEGGITVT